MQLEPGRVFGRYTIECVLGEGAMGRVYRAADATLLRRVALKVLTSKDPDSSRDEVTTDAAAMILKEARAAAAITHENAVTIFDVGEVEGVSYIAMEYIQGSPLRMFIGDASVPMERRLEWLASIARALSAAHDRGLVHRDVKPENVLVREDGVIKVLDFGIAHHRPLGSLGAAAHAPSRSAPRALSSDLRTCRAGRPPHAREGSRRSLRDDERGMRRPRAHRGARSGAEALGTPDGSSLTRQESRRPTRRRERSMRCLASCHCRRYPTCV